MVTALKKGMDVVMNRENCTEEQRKEVYDQITCYNTDNLENGRYIDPKEQVVTLVCHPSCGFGNKQWSELMEIQQPLQLPCQPAYRVLDMDDNSNIQWNTLALKAAASQQWTKVARLAAGVAHSKVSSIINYQYTIKTNLII
jgi:hypothetical protein